MSADLIVIMGPSGAGKSTIAKLLAERTGWRMLDADRFHSEANVSKMTSGNPLTDADRADWVKAMCSAIAADQTRPVVLACSALTRFVQSGLSEGRGTPPIWFLLEAGSDTLKQRMQSRRDSDGAGHFMPVELLASQLDALNPPASAMRLNADRPPHKIVRDICQHLGVQS